MTEIFKKEYQRYGKSVEVIDIGHASKCFKEEVTNFISKSISSVEWTVKRGKKKKEIKLDPNIADWNLFRAKKAYSFEMRVIDDKTLKTKIETTEKMVRIAKKPFSNGACRVTFYILDEATNQVMVTKQFIEKDKNVNKEFIVQLEIHTVAKYLAKKYSNSGVPKKVKFIIPSIIQVGNRFYNSEPLIKGDFVKYNNNFGYVNDEHYHASIDAFRRELLLKNLADQSDEEQDDDFDIELEELIELFNASISKNNKHISRSTRQKVVKFLKTLAELRKENKHGKMHYD
jgi:hypothetical protein